jgi:DNA gyrase subunit A
MIITKSGLTLRIAVDTLRLMGRATQGVRLIKLREDESIADVAKVPKSEEVVVTPVIAETPSEYSDNDNINELENILLDEEIIDNEEEELLEEELPEEELMEEEDSEDDISDIEEEEEE